MSWVVQPMITSEHRAVLAGAKKAVEADLNAGNVYAVFEPLALRVQPAMPPRPSPRPRGASPAHRLA